MRPSTASSLRAGISGLFLLLVVFAGALVAETRDIGSRLELFVDDYMVSELKGGAAYFVHRPQPQEVVLVTGEPWEGNTSAYYTVFRDGDLFRMYYRGSHADEKTQKSLHREVTCYAESRDGVHWTKPQLGLFDWNGSKANNIVLDGVGTHCFVAFRDDNPHCPLEARYKGISRGKSRGLVVFQSADGVHWKLIQDQPVITEGAFDSQNLAFWDPHTEQYVDYHRIFVGGVRSIMTCTSADFVNWTKPVLLKYPGAPNHHLYTNAVRPYPRAPHIRIGFPTRYIPKGSQVEPLFMASRDGVTVRRYDKPVIPMSAPQDRDGNRSNYMANGLVMLPGNDREYSVYATEAYYAGPDSRLRRFTYRVDGFVSIRADDEPGELLTHPIRFDGTDLVVNFATQSGGRISVEVVDESGSVVPGFSLAECRPLEGDDIATSVRWNSGKSIGTLAGKAIRLRFALKHADLYSIQFQSK